MVFPFVQRHAGRGCRHLSFTSTRALKTIQIWGLEMCFGRMKRGFEGWLDFNWAA